jgi:hypothetical protein
MPEQTFRSPNFFEREIDLSAPAALTPSGVPGGIIGTANRGPAFVPVTVGNFNEFVSKFGNLDPKKHGPYAVNEFLKNKTSLTYLRVLGAGSNESLEDMSKTDATGQVKNAGMHLSGTLSTAAGNGNRKNGVVQFLAAEHAVQTSQEKRIPMFSDNITFNTPTSDPHLIRAVFMTPNTARIMVQAVAGTFANSQNDQAVANASGKFEVVISSSLGASFFTTGANAGVKTVIVSLDPSSPDYIAKVLNTDPDKLNSEQHLLYADFPVDAEVADVVSQKVAILSGSQFRSVASGDPNFHMEQAFGSFDTRFKAPQTPWIISQPFGDFEQDLFKFEAVDDGEYANTLYKISIADLRASLDESNPYGTFTVNVRDWNDTDRNPVILESFVNCTLNPNATNYVARLIGDRRVTYNFDMVSENERRITVTGKYPNISKYVRIIMSDDVEREVIQKNCLPFGFRGLSLLKTNDALTNFDIPSPANSRLAGRGIANEFSASVLPPIPFRTKITKGVINNLPSWLGEAASTESVESSLHWGVKFERNAASNVNDTAEKNGLLASYTKFFGLEKLDTFVTGSGADKFNNNKFTLARVALEATSSAGLVGSISQQMKTAAYVRDGAVNSTDYTVDTTGRDNRYTFATLLSKLSASQFNKYSSYMKFTTFLFGGWDGTNIFDRDARRLNDKSTAFDGGAGSSANYTTPGFSTNFAGSLTQNSSVQSYKTAIDIMTDPMFSSVNILAIPGIREEYLTTYAMNKVRDYGLAFYVMDIPAYDDSAARIFDDSTSRPSVLETIRSFDSRVIDNNYAGTYFPDVFIDDAVNRRRVKVPASIAALSALANTDRVRYPWFAPAGFDRASLEFVSNVGVRLNVSDRDSLYDSRINPIATFPRLGYVIYGQKTLQINKSALDRVNVRRLLLEVKRIVIGSAQRLVFEQNTPDVRSRFVAEASLALSAIQSQSGVDAFQVIMNESNNTQDDIDNNRLNGKIIVVPTRVIEYIAIDFIITNSGVQFV